MSLNNLAGTSDSVKSDLTCDSAWIAGVDCDEDAHEEACVDEEDSDDHLPEQLDPNEVADILHDQQDEDEVSVPQANEEANDDDSDEDSDSTSEEDSTADNDEEDPIQTETPGVRRSTRARVPTSNFEPSFQGVKHQETSHLQVPQEQVTEHDLTTAQVAVNLLTVFKQRMTRKIAKEGKNGEGEQLFHATSMLALGRQSLFSPCVASFSRFRGVLSCLECDIKREPFLVCMACSSAA